MAAGVPISRKAPALRVLCRNSLTFASGAFDGTTIVATGLVGKVAYMPSERLVRASPDVKIGPDLSITVIDSQHRLSV